MPADIYQAGSIYRCRLCISDECKLISLTNGCESLRTERLPTCFSHRIGDWIGTGFVSALNRSHCGPLQMEPAQLSSFV